MPFGCMGLWTEFNVDVVTVCDAGMRYVAAYMLAALAKKGSVNSSDICKILGSVGIEADNNRVDQVVNELSGRNLVDIITDGWLLFLIVFCHSFLHNGSHNLWNNKFVARSGRFICRCYWI